MELGKGRGSQLGEEDPPYIVRGQIQPLPTYSARDMRYYRISKRYYRTGLRYYRSRGRSQVRLCCTRQRAVELPERYYCKAEHILGWEGTN